ncbi:MAG: hypothetical protein R2794_14015 [Chitinophagales bacterium]
MKRSDLYEVAVKMLGMYLLFTALLYFQYFITGVIGIFSISADLSSMMGFQMIYILQFVFAVVVGICIIRQSAKVTRWICKASDFEKDLNMQLSRQTIYEIAIVLLGLILLLGVVQQTVELITSFVIKQNTRDFMPSAGQNDLTIQLITLILKVVIAFYALTQSANLSAALTRNKPQHSAELDKQDWEDENSNEDVS